MEHQRKDNPLKTPFALRRQCSFQFPGPPSLKNNVEIMSLGRLVQNQQCIGGGEGEMKTKITFRQDSKVSQDYRHCRYILLSSYRVSKLWTVRPAWLPISDISQGTYVPTATHPKHSVLQLPPFVRSVRIRNHLSERTVLASTLGYFQWLSGPCGRSCHEPSLDLILLTECFTFWYKLRSLHY